MSILGRKIFRKNDTEAKPISNLLDYVAPTSIEFQRNKMILGEAFARTYTVFGYPHEVNVKWLEPISRTQNSIISYHVNKTDVSILIEDIQRSINSEKLKISETMSDIDKQTSQASIENLLDLAEELSINKSDAVNVTISVTIFDKDPVILDKRCEDFVSNMKGKRFKARPMDKLQKEGFDNMLPVVNSKFHDLSGIDMALKAWSGSLGYLATQGLNDITGTFIGSDNSGEPIFFDLMSRNNARMNANGVIVGIPGSGKSTLSKMIMVDAIARGTKVIVIDAEREYTSLAKEMGGSVIESSGSTNARINPLQLRDVPERWDDFNNKEELEHFLNTEGYNQKGPLSTHVTWLKKWFKTYIPTLSSREIASLEDAAYETYDRYGITERTDPRDLPNTGFPVMTDLYNVLMEASNSGTLRGVKKDQHEIQAIKTAMTLIRSAVTGADKFLFNGHTTVNMDSPFTVFDVHSLMTSNEEQKNAQFFNITTFCWLAVTKNKTERVMLIVDEAHLFISRRENQVFEWLSTSSRRFRKYEGALWLMTQNTNDFYQQSVREYGETLLNSPSNKFVLQQLATDLDRLEQWFKLSTGEKEAVRGARRGHALMLVGNVRSMIRIEPSRNFLAMIERAGSGR